MTAKYVIAIDPGTTQSGVCIVRTEDYRPLWCAKVDNEKLWENVDEQMARLQILWAHISVVIERMQGNGYAVSSDVFITCEWIGRFAERFRQYGVLADYVRRNEEYKDLCSNLYGHNDKGVRAALVDRFAYGMPSFGKGTKKNPGWFYGFAADSWSAYACAVTFLDRQESHR